MVKEGQEDVRAGRTISHEEVERMVEEWERAGR
jgi:predicted transcriptional regulator